MRVSSSQKFRSSSATRAPAGGCDWCTRAARRGGQAAAAAAAAGGGAHPEAQHLQHVLHEVVRQGALLRGRREGERQAQRACVRAQRAF